MNTLHDERPHTAVRLLDSQDLASGVRPNRSLRLLPEGKADNEVAMRSTPSSECFKFSKCSILVAMGPGLECLLATDASIQRARATAWRITTQAVGRTPPAGARPHGPPGAPA